jgi:hypothetical protein
MFFPHPSGRVVQIRPWVLAGVYELGMIAVKVDVGSKIETTGTLTDDPVAIPKLEPRMQRGEPPAVESSCRLTNEAYVFDTMVAGVH